MESEAPLTYASPAGRGVLGAAVLGSGMAFLDSTVVNVALPALGRDLHTNLAGLQWTVDAYLLTLTAFLLLGGVLGDRLGARTMLLWGVCGFGVASGFCGLAPNLLTLGLARALQGIAAAVLVPNSLAILRSSFVEEDQGRVIGAWSGLSGVSAAVGPLLGGWLLGFTSWRVLFFINLPVAAATFTLAVRAIPQPKLEREKRGTDALGAALAVIGLGGTIEALIEGPAHGWSRGSLFALGVGLASLAAFLAQERRSPHALLPLHLFGSRQFSGANLLTLCVYFALNAGLFLLGLELQTVLGYSPLQAGASFLPVTVLMLALSPTAGRLAQRVGYRAPLTLGPLVVGAGMVWLSFVKTGGGYLALVLPGVVVLGFGLAMTVAPLTTAVLSGVEARYAGTASGVNNAVARLAGLLGVAVLPWAAGLAAKGATAGAAFSAGYARAMRLSAGLCAAGALFAWRLLRRVPSPALGQPCSRHLAKKSVAPPPSST